MSTAGRAADPVEDYTATLRARLHGPARAKARMIEEIRDGLLDTVAAHTGEGTPYHRAARYAVREFGTPEELIPGCQRELTIAQARHTARAVALTAPFLIGCWYLVIGFDPPRQLPPAAQLLALLLAAVAAGSALFAAATLAATGALARRLRTPRRLPLAVAWAGTAAGVAMGIAALALAAASVPAADGPSIVCAGLLTAVSHGVVAASARACRRCARPQPLTPEPDTAGV
ncbi:permease prefix domain 1-containing protein [Streptomyces sp. NPDC018031]|uniref:permease prefix domain 1-containing protein n=1 Tax=Streptomyces sp. NPDC018031 TaxID=3365033 RepID=UPI0037AD3538